MAGYRITLPDGDEELVADAYVQEGPLTTFFRFDDGRQVVDSWSTRVASFRTVDIVAIRRTERIGSEMPLAA